MTLGLRGGLGLLLAATLFSAPAVGQQRGDEDEQSEESLDGVSDVVQDVAQDVVERSLEKPPFAASTAADDTVQGLGALNPIEEDAARAVRPNLVRPSMGHGGLQGAEGAAGFGDDALHAVPVGSFGDDAARAVPVGTFADDAVRGVGSGAASVADDAVRAAGGGCAKAFAGMFAVLGALLAKLFGGKKDE